MLSDYRDVARGLSGQLPFANAVRTDWMGQAQPWLAAHAAEAVLWPIASHLAFWDNPDSFNRRLVQFLRTGT